MIRLTLDSGSRIEWPSAQTAAEMADLLGPRIEYLTISRTSGEFVQAAWCRPADPDGSVEYLLEAKRSPDAALMATRTPGLGPVRAAFACFVAGDWTWMDGYEWSPAEWVEPTDG
jgi:hypothetical protein